MCNSAAIVDIKHQIVESFIDCTQESGETVWAEVLIL